MVEEKKRKRKSPTKPVSFNWRWQAVVVFISVLVAGLILMSPSRKCSDLPHIEKEMIPPYSYLLLDTCTGKATEGILKERRFLHEQQMMRQGGQVG